MVECCEAFKHDAVKRQSVVDAVKKADSIRPIHGNLVPFIRYRRAFSFIRLGVYMSRQQIQTRRNPTNERKHKLRVNHALKEKFRKFYFKWKGRGE